MKIIDISKCGEYADGRSQQTRGNSRGSKKYQVIIEGQPDYSLYRSDIKALKLEVGDDVDESTISKIVEILYKRGLKYCYHLIGKKDYTCGQIREKLATKQYPEGVVEAVLLKLQELELLNDEQYAKRYLETYESHKSYKWIEQKLYQKGIRLSDYDISRSVDGEKEALEKTARQWFRRRGLHMEDAGIVGYDQQKLKTFLYRKGFAMRQIQDLVERLH